MRRRFFVGEQQTNFDYNNYLTIEALEDSVEVILPYNTTEYGVDGYGWRNYKEPIFLSSGQLLSLRDDTIRYAYDSIKINGKCNLLGNCMSLVYKDGAKDEKSMICSFYRLFADCVGIQTVSSSFLPAKQCKSNCYYEMFYGCTSLVNAPELPATTLADSCYYEMFYGCTSLVNAPELPATTLADSCYGYMFYGCSKLNYIKALFTTTPSLIYTSNWVKGVAFTGTFVKNPDATWDVNGDSGVPSGWTVKFDGEEDGWVI